MAVTILLVARVKTQNILCVVFPKRALMMTILLQLQQQQQLLLLLLLTLK